jgi:hypothetical protein
MTRALGKVDLLGLNSFGNPVGLNPIWGVAIGGGTSAVVTMAARHSGSVSLMARPELFGIGAGLAVSGAMYAMKSTRHAAIGSVVGTFIGAGLAYLEKLVFGTAQVAAATATQAQVQATGTAGMGIPTARMLGIPQARNLNGFGVPMISERHTPAGTIPGVAGNQLAGAGFSAPPVSLLGPTSPQAAHLRGIGGPAVHGLSAAYGATLLGGGR